METGAALRTLVATVGMAGASLFSTLACADLYIISNSVTPIAAGEVKEIFTGEKQFSGSTKLTPVDNGPAQEIFLSAVLKMDSARYNTIWTKKSFREGMIPPFVKSGDNEVIDLVRKTPGAVGYVSIQPSGVNLVRKY